MSSYTKSDTWHEAKKINILRQRIKNARRNVAVYRALTSPHYVPYLHSVELSSRFGVSRQRLYAIKDQVEEMITRGEIDPDLFDC